MSQHSQQTENGGAIEPHQPPEPAEPTEPTDSSGQPGGVGQSGRGGEDGKPRGQSPVAGGARWGALAFVIVFAVAALTMVVANFRGEPLTKVDEAVLEAAAETWGQASVSNYTMTVRLEGRMNNVFELRVEQGVLVSAKRDGQALEARRLPRAWTVEGMFDTLRRDQELQAAAARGEASGRFLKMLATFDESVGYPRRYLRIEMVKRGGNSASGWEVVDFQPF